jgi:hypothetical protein
MPAPEVEWILTVDLIVAWAQAKEAAPANSHEGAAPYLRQGQPERGCSSHVAGHATRTLR